MLFDGTDTRAGETMKRDISGGRAVFSVAYLVTLILFLLAAGRAQTAGQSNNKNDDNVVLRWNQAALDSIVATRTSPAIAARALAILHTCIFDAWAACA